MKRKLYYVVCCILWSTTAAAAPSSSRIVLQPQAGAMQVAARVPGLDDQAFALGIPETIGCREALLVNFPEARVEWQVGEESTTVSRLYLARGTLDEFLQRQAADRPGLAARQQWARPVEVARDSKPHGRMEEMLPDQLEQVLAEAPVAFVPLGTYEHHGFHLPVCFDGIKAHALCERVAQRTGGTVLPTFFYGTGGGHVGYKWTLMLPELQIVPLIEATLDHLARQGFKVVVLLTGHYPQEQVDMVHRLAQDAQRRHPQVKFIGLTEPEVTTPQPGDAYGGDHAAKYETSIALALNPDWVHLGNLTAGRDPAQVTLPDTPRKEVSTHDPTHPLYAIYGQDPRSTASKELGDKLVAEIVSRLTAKVEQALAGESPAVTPADSRKP